MEQVRPGERLAEAVKQRRAELRRSRQDVVSRAHTANKPVSMSWVVNVEKAEQDRYAQDKLEGLDHGLDWSPGTSQDILSGTDAPVAEPARGTETIDARRERVNDELNRLAQVAGPDAIRKLTDAEAVIVVIRCLSDDQYDLFSRAVQADPRYSALTS